MASTEINGANSEVQSAEGFSLFFPHTKPKYWAIGWSSLLRVLKRSISYNLLFSSQWLELGHVSGGLMSFMRTINCQFWQNLNRLCCFLIWNGSKRFCDKNLHLQMCWMSLSSVARSCQNLTLNDNIRWRDKVVTVIYWKFCWCEDQHSWWPQEKENNYLVLNRRMVKALT